MIRDVLAVRAELSVAIPASESKHLSVMKRFGTQLLPIQSEFMAVGGICRGAFHLDSLDDSLALVVGTAEDAILLLDQHRLKSLLQVLVKLFFRE